MAIPKLDDLVFGSLLYLQKVQLNLFDNWHTSLN
jgi:hypothetical protein